MNTEKLKKLTALPSHLLKEITENDRTEEPANLLSEKELFATADHTNTDEYISDFSPSDTSEAPTYPTTGESPVNNPAMMQAGTSIGSAVSGKLAVDLIDLIFPSIAIFGLSYAGYEGLNRRDLGMNKTEKETIAPHMQAYLNSINVSFDNPLNNLLFVLGGIYAGKLAEKLPELTRVSKRGKGAKIASIDPTESQEETNERIIRGVMSKRKCSREKAIEFILKQQQKQRA